MSYQNSTSSPQRIEELGIRPEDLARKKSRRRLLFTALIVTLLLSFATMAVAMHLNQKRREQDAISSGFGLQNLKNATAVKTGCETTVLLMRHCEKFGPEVKDEDGNQHCSFIGLERAQYITTLFGHKAWPIPDFLYALSPIRPHHFNFREVETLRPLAQKYSLPIQSDFETNKELATHFFSLLGAGSLCGKTSIVSWKHESIPDLSRKLGCLHCPHTYPVNSFDQVWQLKYVYDVKGMLSFSSSGRQLRKKKKAKEWSVYSTVVPQGFDPLKFSARHGDYDGNSPVGGHWFEEQEEGEM